MSKWVQRFFYTLMWFVVGHNLDFTTANGVVLLWIYWTIREHDDD